MVVARKHKRMPFMGTPAHGHRKPKRRSVVPVQSSTLIDDVLAQSEDWGAKRLPSITRAALVSLLRRSHKMVLDHKATDLFISVWRNLPDLILEQERFAVFPYENTWIEIPASPEEKDFSLGVLRGEDGRVHFFTRHNHDPKVRLSFFAVDLHTPWPLAERVKAAHAMSVSVEELALEVWTPPPRSGDEHKIIPEERILSRLEGAERHRIVFYGYPECKHLAAVSLVRGVLALLLLLNRPTKPPVYTNVPASRGFIRNKLRPFVAHTRVTLDLDAKAPLLPLSPVKGVGSSKRHHEVRHHYAHRWRSRSCDHDYVRLPRYSAEVESDASRHCAWRCSRCDTLRYRVKWHTRGDSLRGVSVQEHEVTSSRSG